MPATMSRFSFNITFLPILIKILKILTFGLPTLVAVYPPSEVVPTAGVTLPISWSDLKDTAPS